MSKIILQPCGNKNAREHYNDTIENEVTISTVAKHVDSNLLKEIQRLYPQGTVPVWGVTPGKKNANVSKWERMNPDDIVLFSQDGHIFFSAVVTLKFRSESLALELWGHDETGQTWEYIYLVDEIIHHKIPYLVFNGAAGYEDKYIIQGYQVLGEEKSNKIVAAFDLRLYETSKEEYQEAVKDFDPGKTLDKDVQTKQRTEQKYLRERWFKEKKTSICGICSREFPVDLLITSHIKKRANCIQEEKLDWANIVMPMCKFGCDDLYEKGYITVEDGRIKQLNDTNATEPVAQYIMNLFELKCPYWTEERKKYFEWHRKYHSK